MTKKAVKPVTKGVAKVPVVMQLEALECGAACLTMVLSYYKKWIPLEKVRSDCGVSRDGSNAKNVLKAARSYGLEAQGYRMEPDTLKEEGTFPCIIHWNFNHFVVCNGFKNGYAYINDPARGTVKITMEEFDNSFTGICLGFEPGEDFEPGGKKKSMLGYAKKRLKGAGPAVAFLLLIMIITDLMELITPGLSRVFLDVVLGGNNPGWFMPFFTFLALFSVLNIVVAWIQAVYMLRVNGKMAVVGNTSYMWKVLRLPIEFFSQRMAGDITQRQATNAMIAQDLMNTITPLFIDTFMMIFYLIVMVRYSLILSVVGIFSILVDLFMSGIMAKKRVNITRVQMRDAGKLSGATVSGIEMIETIKASGAETGFFGKWSGYQASVNQSQMEYQRVTVVLSLIPQAVSTISADIVLMLGVFLTMNGQFTIGMIMAFQGYLQNFTMPATTLINAGQTIQEMRTDMERIEDVMEYPDAVEESDDTDSREVVYDKLKGNVELKNVTFGYSKLGEPLIKDFSLTMKPGSRIALVGSSGCGKSTISKLISGLYEPWSGEILYDGKKKNEYDRSVFTGSLAVVDQDIILFEDTIANNIKMWDKSIEDFEMIMAARDAQIHDDIVVREGGYDYKITEGGKDFSGGQRQRLEIARVLAQDPTIIILDEATSALDARTEYEVVKSIRDRGITCLVVAHRLSTIRDCDEIIVLDKGNVVERGTHDELYAKGGYYTALVSSE
ncbi:MAG: NHLP family bacteriocin export ABC transporter peptidase/permease/ATPase subunit [Lachnospiraceae bacterium]|nr:NHLP family bacteriocin export ABC transporter peptidase/permease/ATPase subunit [Lachnospiraceae bacterium]